MTPPAASPSTARVRGLGAEALRSIVERASLPDERRGSGFVPTAEGDEARVAWRMGAWRELVAGGDAERFARRLALEGLDEASARRGLGPVRLAEGRRLPAWAALLDRAVAIAPAAAPPVRDAGAWAEAHPFLDPAAPLPYEHVLVPLVVAARGRLRRRAGRALRLLAPEARAQLERGLLSTLSFWFAPAAHGAFALARAGSQSALDRMVARVRGERPTELYAAWIGELYAGGFGALWSEYPVLARVAATAALHWADATAEMARRLAADLPALADTLGGGAGPGRVVHAAPGLSDRHHQGRVVAALTFASGLRTVYKPKGLACEEAWNALLAWLAERGAPHPLPTYRVLDRGTHGWAQFIEHAPCADADELRAFYRRAGALACVLHALSGTDAHCENVIATRAGPVLVDAEALLHPPAPFEDDDPPDLAARGLSRASLLASALRTGIFPGWEMGAAGEVFDLSALRPVTGQTTVVRVPRFRDPGTDLVELEAVPGTVRAHAHLPVPEGAPVPLAAHADPVVDGFAATYRFLAANREALLAPDGPVERFRPLATRFLRRGSRLYVQRLMDALQPQWLRDGADFGVRLDVLSREMLDGGRTAEFWPVLAREKRSLARLDIPFFLAACADGAVTHRAGAPPGPCRALPGLPLVRARIAALDAADLRRQAALGRASLGFIVPTFAADGPEPADDLDLLRTTAERAGWALRRRAIPLSGGGASWLAPEPRLEGLRHQFLPLPHDLYGGAAGVALFLAALGRASGERWASSLARAALRPLRRTLRDRDTASRLAEVAGIGGGTGMGGMAYALVRCAALLDDDALLADARRAARLVGARRIAADGALDVVGGAAGAVLGLLAVHRATGSGEALERAAACGTHLLSRRAQGGGPRGWPSAGRPPLAGAAHGAAGIAYALLRLSRATGDAAFREAAAEGMAFEDTLFRADAGGWADLREAPAGSAKVRESGVRSAEMPSSGAQPPSLHHSITPSLHPDDAPVTHGWCGGAAGIGLARLAGLSALDTPAARRDVERAAASVLAFGVGELDHLCCGALGRAEFLAHAGRALDRPDLAEEGRRRAVDVARAARRTGGFRLSALLPAGAFVPGLFQGVAGAGYALLRHADPAAHPSVLLWEVGDA